MGGPRHGHAAVVDGHIGMVIGALSLRHEPAHERNRLGKAGEGELLANGVALIPLIVAGGIADLYGVSTVVIAIGVLVAIGGALSLYLDQRWLRHEGDQPPADGGSGHWDRRISNSIDTV